MQRTKALITLGILTALVPFSGLPGSWRSVLSVIFGLSIAAIVYFNKPAEEHSDSYDEHD